MLEPHGLSRADGKKPDGMSMVPWKKGRCIIWDFTCVDTFAPSHLDITSVRSGRAAEEAAVRKTRKYEYLGQQFIFLPVAVETSGVWDPAGLRFLREIGVRVATVTLDKESQIDGTTCGFSVIHSALYKSCL